SSAFPDPGSPGHITFNVGTFSATDSAILARGDGVGGGAVTIQGLQGSETFVHAVSLTNTEVATSATEARVQNGGPILLRADNIVLNQSTLNASGLSLTASGPITLVSRGGIDLRNSNLSAGVYYPGGAINLNAGRSITLTNTNISAGAVYPGSITMAAP